MPDYLIYNRSTNSKTGKLLFKGEPIKAVDIDAAIYKALRKDSNMSGGRSKLRRGRLMAVLAPAIKEVTVTVPEHVEGLTPEEMVNVLKPKVELT
jgi:predicted secreted protein